MKRCTLFSILLDFKVVLMPSTSEKSVQLLKSQIKVWSSSWTSVVESILLMVLIRQTKRVLTDCCPHLATRAAVSLQVFDELWSGSVSNCGQCCTAIGQPVTNRKWRGAISRGLILSERCTGFHIPTHLVWGASPWGVCGLRQGMDMMLMLR